MNINRLPSLFRNVKREPNRFGYRSRFYDAEKEEFEKRIKSIENDLESEDYSPEKKFSFGRNRNDDWIKSSYKKQVVNSNLVIMVVLIILCFISYAVITYLQTANV